MIFFDKILTTDVTRNACRLQSRRLSERERDGERRRDRESRLRPVIRRKRTVRVRDGQKSYEVMDEVKKYERERKEESLLGERARERLCVCILKH